jgi:hypothetical protein
MELRLSSRDLSLDGEVERGALQTHLDSLADHCPGTEALFGQAEHERLVHKHVQDLMPSLNEVVPDPRATKVVR